MKWMRMDLGKPVGIYRVYEKKTAPDTTAVTFEGPKVARGTIVKLTHASILDYTSANKNMVLGVRNVKGVDHYFEKSEREPSSECHLHGVAFLLADERVIGVMTDPGTNDVIYFSVHGLVYTSE